MKPQLTWHVSLYGSWRDICTAIHPTRAASPESVAQRERWLDDALGSHCLVADDPEDGDDCATGIDVRDVDDLRDLLNALTAADARYFSWALRVHVETGEMVVDACLGREAETHESRCAGRTEFHARLQREAVNEKLTGAVRSALETLSEALR